jgi:hypothetical protein
MLHSRRYVAYAITVAIFGSGGLARASTHAAPSPLQQRALGPALVAATPMPLRLANPSRLPRTTRYSLVDFGAPAGYGLESPTSFNNTGQVVGEAVSGQNGVIVCELYDGAHYRTLNPGSLVTGCVPMGVNDENAGLVDVVGSVEYTYQQGAVALYSAVNLATKKIVTTLAVGYSNSAIVGVNPGGTAVGTSYYNPIGNWDDGLAQAPFEFVPPGAPKLLQTGCGSLSAGCGALSTPSICPFGGCAITSDGSVLLLDLFGPLAFEILPKPGGTPTTVPLDYAAYESGVFPIINNAKQVLYATFSSNYQYVYTTLYQPVTKKSTVIPLIAKSTCKTALPLSLNNKGQVLGWTANCSNPADQTFFTYDASHGTQDLAAALPDGTARVTPVGNNDKGQILVYIYGGGSNNRWGILQPK